MNKAELINAVAVSADVSKKEAEAVVSATLDAITAALNCELASFVLRSADIYSCTIISASNNI